MIVTIVVVYSISDRILLAEPEAEMAMTAGNTKVVWTMCPMNCHPTFYGMLVEVEGGRLKSISGDKDNPGSQGFLCVRGRSTNEIFGNPTRLLYPQIRDDRRTNTWRRASWDEALDFIVKRMRAVGSEADRPVGRTRRLYAGWRCRRSPTPDTSRTASTRQKRSSASICS
jgi:anaerobic selenocysteine-containing dehydrogenase